MAFFSLPVRSSHEGEKIKTLQKIINCCWQSEEIYVGFKLINATRDRINCMGLNLMNGPLQEANSSAN